MSKSVLLNPFKLGGIGELKNRVVLAPLTRARSGRSQIPNDANILYYTQRASAGLIITEGAILSKQAMGWQGAPGIYNEDHVEGWKKVTQAVHEKGGKIFCQLWHLGRVAHSEFHGLQPIAPSAIKVDGQTHIYGGKKDYEVPRPIDISEIPAILSEYKNAAQCAKDAGFDGVEIHGANGYFLDIFLQSVSNTRDDDYGGSKENRFRLWREVLNTVCSVFPSTSVGIRISPNGAFNGMGSPDNFETFSYAIGELESYKLAYIHIMDGLAFGYHGKCPQFTLYDCRKAGYTGALIGNCGYDQAHAEGAVGSGVVDLIAFGRDYISNPDLVERYENKWPLNPPANYMDWYECTCHEPDRDPNLGYTDFPFYQPTDSEAK